jgi:hypothetical protein
MKKVHEDISKKLQQAQDQSILYINKKRKTALQLKRGDKVYLYTKNLRTTRLNKGLNNVKVGPFLISKRNRPVTYILNLPKDAKIYSRFHVKLLESANLKTLLQRTFRYKTKEENVFEVKKIIAHCGNNHNKEFLVK